MAALEVSKIAPHVNHLADSRFSPDIPDLTSLAALKQSCAQIGAQKNAFRKMDISIKHLAFTDAGELLVFFSQEEIDTPCRPFLHSLIVKCSYGRPSI